MKCYFYDDGHGNGAYCSSMSCGPPSCNLSKKYITPECNGDTSICEVNRSIAEQRTLLSKTISNLKKIQDERI